MLRRIIRSYSGESYLLELDDQELLNALRLTITSEGQRVPTLAGRVRISFEYAGVIISNPGGFIEGITLSNLLEAEPHGRNPVLADALKRIGLAEQSGRGIDRIFEGFLQYGSTLPDYSQSTNTMVRVVLPRIVPDKAFGSMVAQEHSKQGRSLSVKALLVLNALRNI